MNVPRLILISLLGTAGALAQPTTPAAAPPANPSPAPVVDWANLAKFRDDDRQLPPPAPGESRVVFMGDSITAGWNLAGFFPGRPYVNRGISGQTTAQMLARFRQDVIALKPAAVVILAGTNDIAENNGPVPIEGIEANLQSMVELAEFNHIRVVLAAVLPAEDFPWRRGLQPAGKIVALNQWIASYCSRNHLVHLDYFSPMVGARQELRGELSRDGVHPNPAGYAIMAPLAEKAIAQVLATKPR